MNNKIKPYEEYKETGVFWLSHIPKHWKWLYLFQTCNEKQIKNSEDLVDNVLSLSYGNIIRKKNIDFGLVPKEYNTYQIVEKDNLILRLTDLQNDKRSLRTGLVKETGIITSAYTCLKVNKSNNPVFIHYLLHSFDTIKVFYGMGGGVRQSIGFNDIRKLKIPIPPRAEQDHAVKYLDFQLAKINKLIKNKKKLIAVLKEQKQATINEAVTKGINPNVKIKPSGIKWLGDIPEHWEIKPLKSYVRSNIETLTENYDKESVIRYIDISTVGFGELRGEPVQYKFKDAPSRARRIVHTGDTIISTVRTYLKSMCFIDESLKDCIVSTGFAVLTPNKLVYPRFLNYVLSSLSFVNQVSKSSIGVSYPAISESKLTSIKVALPNGIDEQQRILNYITKKTLAIDKSICGLEKEINLITEYRIRLIFDVVTGKIDVSSIVIDNVIPEESDVNEIEDEILDNEENLDSEDGVE